MDRDEALKLLKGGLEGVAEWNRLRAAGDVIPDLVVTDFTDTALVRANLVRANLTGSNFSRASLAGADLSGSDLVAVNLSGADLTGANLDGANLGGATLSGADFNGANLSGVNINGAKLNGANLGKARCQHTVFSNIDLSDVLGLESITHWGPSTIGTDTLIRSRGTIPVPFLRGCGVPDAWIANLPALIGALEPIQFYSVFISYSSKDTGFAERLHADLRSKGVLCWFAPHDLPIGAKIRIDIDEAIRVHDKLLLVLSKYSVASDWVEKEVETAMEQERRQKRTVLFPIRIDDAIMKAEVGWAADIRRSRNIGDFCKWKDHDTYQKSFDRLLRDLKAEDSRA